MPKLLKIDVSPRGDYSISRKLSGEFAAQWQKAHPEGAIVVRDLFKTALPFVDLPWIGGAYAPPDQHTPEQAAAIKISDDLTDELLNADEILLSTPMYNFNVPAALKAWIDHIVRLDKTFNAKYEGLVKGKKATIIIASAGLYTPGAHAENFNAESGYLKQILGFIGITDIAIVLAGGSSAVDQGKVSREEFLAPFEAEVTALSK